MRALIDGDAILYNCGFASQHKYYYVYIDEEEEDGYIAKFKYKKEAEEFRIKGLGLEIYPEIEIDPKALAIYNTKEHISKILRDTEATDYIIYFSDSELERDEIATLQKYKGNRDDAPKPIWYKEIKHFVTSNYNCETVPGLEADDCMAINQTKDTIICTADKDLDMVEGWRYKGGKTFIITKEEAQLAFYTQLITGDSTDNIPGLFRLTGVKASKKIKEGLKELTTPQEMYQYVKEVYIKAFGCDRELNDVDVVLLEIGRLLWMKRKIDEDWEIPK